MEGHEGDYVRDGQKHDLLLFGSTSISPRGGEQDLASNYSHIIIWEGAFPSLAGSL